MLGTGFLTFYATIDKAENVYYIIDVKVWLDLNLYHGLHATLKILRFRYANAPQKQPKMSLVPDLYL